MTVTPPPGLQQDPAEDERMSGHSAVRTVRPGESAARLAGLVSAGLRRCSLDLSGVTVLTEAATGPYVVTPVIAAAAGAEVIALTAPSRFGSVAQVTAETAHLAQLLGVADRIQIVVERRPQDFARADLITNCGHVRPIIGDCADAIRPGAAISLMFESWEVQAGRFDLDLQALRAKGVQIAGTNERHPDVNVFSYLGLMAVAELADAGIPTYQNVIGVLCDNPFASYLESGLRAAGASVVMATQWEGLRGCELDAVLVAMTPTGRSTVDRHELHEHGSRRPEVPVIQFWGDVDRAWCAEAGVEVWPRESPGEGHMGVLPSRLGPDAIVRLQCGGLKVGQILLTPQARRRPEENAYVDA